MYSIPERRFLPDRYIVGTCPICGYESARGDQCENCTNLLDPTDLINPRSAVTGTTELEVRESRHLFLLQSKLAPELRAWLETKDDWPVLSRSIALKWLDEGLEDRGITRDLKWGVPVDRPGFEDKVFYVWFDAPIEYIGATKEWSDARGEPDAWRSWWYDADDVRYAQFMAKDNVPFHSVGFPSTIIGSREPWKLVDYLKSFNWLTYYGGKFSTSQGVGVFMDDALEVMPADVWRYYLMANAPESDDASFSWESFAVTVNKDLADTLGNLVNRTLTFTQRYFDALVPAGGEPGDAERELEATLARDLATYTELLAGMEFRKAMQVLRSMWSAGNVYLDRKAPWASVREDREATAVTLRTAINLIALYARLAAPVMPTTAALLLESLGVAEDARDWPLEIDLTAIGGGAPLAMPGLLFRKVSDEDVAGWKARFGGGVEQAA
jgi:methionyl-tRNA synthetase